MTLILRYRLMKQRKASASSAPRRENKIRGSFRFLWRLRRRGVYPAPDAGLFAMTERTLHRIPPCARKIDQFVSSKASVFYPQEFAAGLQINAFPLQLQAGSLCYNASAFDPRPSVAKKNASEFQIWQ
ncbi:hypothetical protein D6833_04610 [Candidatus Parcubacteria bacterium]|nr:MAG: hypothetical protein D6833_04610 [Candidatus Parcubacteria bacterium]